MNTDWINFLKSNKATFTANSEIIFPENQLIKNSNITAVAGLAIIKVCGKEAETFLQGQLTCNIKEINDSNSFFAAFCNAKGRTISTLLIFKKADDFLLILPNVLVGKVIQKLRLYVLRSDVLLVDASDEFCLIGLTMNNPEIPATYPKSNFAVTHDSGIIIKLPSKDNRFLFVCSAAAAKSVWSEFMQNNNTSISNSQTWTYQDISAGLPWLTETSSEDFIPQMLNIDKLGGISFNKGCYTGQEIVARTHYLGKAKRELFLAECDKTDLVSNAILDVIDEKNKSIGKVLSIQSNSIKHRILIVIPTTEANSKNLLINNSNPARISIIDFQ